MNLMVYLRKKRFKTITSINSYPQVEAVIYRTFSYLSLTWVVPLQIVRSYMYIQNSLLIQPMWDWRRTKIPVAVLIRYSSCIPIVLNLDINSRKSVGLFFAMCLPRIHFFPIQHVSSYRKEIWLGDQLWCNGVEIVGYPYEFGCISTVTWWYQSIKLNYF